MYFEFSNATHFSKLESLSFSLTPALYFYVDLTWNASRYNLHPFFPHHYRFDFPSHTKWIAFGGSYPGSLAAWLRYKYPHLVQGAMSASGPLLAQVDFRDYFRVVYEALETYSEECVKTVKDGTAQIAVLLQHMVGQRSINDKFKLCDPVEKSVKNPLDISNLYETLSGNFAGVVQYNKDNRKGKSAKAANITIDTVRMICNSY